MKPGCYVVCDLIDLLYWLDIIDARVSETFDIDLFAEKYTKREVE